ncbi:hypothetical protein RND71_044163 [Anisodus tanguticus]|uniref:Uncharacterized protein n=1 Tax=Anisodus tanguticus TaxID=243964 RepID=A0AAE1QPL5_9SOLA|nr:hypothetical protein RND71_044163 [Anisodus tanguticus]
MNYANNNVFSSNSCAISTSNPASNSTYFCLDTTAGSFPIGVTSISNGSSANHLNSNSTSNISNLDNVSNHLLNPMMHTSSHPSSITSHNHSNTVGNVINTSTASLNNNSIDPTSYAGTAIAAAAAVAAALTIKKLINELYEKIVNRWTLPPTTNSDFDYEEEEDDDKYKPQIKFDKDSVRYSISAKEDASNASTNEDQLPKVVVSDFSVPISPHVVREKENFNQDSIFVDNNSDPNKTFEENFENDKEHKTRVPLSPLNFETISKKRDQNLQIVGRDRSNSDVSLGSSIIEYDSNTSRETNATPIKLATLNQDFKCKFEPQTTYKNNVKTSVLKIGALFYKNITLLRRNLPLLLFQFLLPSLEIILFSLCIGADPFNIPIAVFNQDSSGNLSQRFLESIDGYTVQQINKPTLPMAIESARNGEAWGAIAFKQNFSSALSERLMMGLSADNHTIDQSNIYIFLDMTIMAHCWTRGQEVILGDQSHIHLLEQGNISQGLCCPIGTIVLGDKDFILRVHRLRKALGGGMRQIGDIHAVTSANNLIAAALESRAFHEATQSDQALYQKLVPRTPGVPRKFNDVQKRRLEKLDLPADTDPDLLTPEQIKEFSRLNINTKQLEWNRVLDLDDRFLREITIGKGYQEKGFVRDTKFEISVSSELMSVLSVCQNLKDARERIGNIVVAFSREEPPKPITCEDLGIAGAVTVLLKDAIRPNIIQTLEGGPAIMHCGAPTGYIFPVIDIRPAIGGGYLCPFTGDVSALSDLPTRPAYIDIDIDTETEEIKGLF